MITRSLCIAFTVLTALPSVADDRRAVTLQEEGAAGEERTADSEGSAQPSQDAGQTNESAESENAGKGDADEEEVSSEQGEASSEQADAAVVAEPGSEPGAEDAAGRQQLEDAVSVDPPAAEVAPAELEVAATPEVEPLALLGETVSPGSAAKLAWTAHESFDGISAPTPILVVHGAKPGPKLCITAAVHGDELNGIEVVRRVIYDLDPANLTGTVIGVPIVNLQGFRRASRYLPDRRDLNRYFPGSPRGSSASRIANAFFRDVVSHCDLLVDLHTGSFHRTNLPQLRADLHNPAVKELAQSMGSIVVLHSRGAAGSLRRAATDRGIPAVTLEAGEPHKVDLDAVDHGVQSVEALLHKRGMYERRSLWTRQIEPMYYKSRWVRAPNGGILTSRITLGERVKTGDVLGTVTDPITNYTVEIDTPISGRVIGMALNQVMQPGFAAYHIGFQSTAEEAAKHDAGPDDASGDELEMERPLGQNVEKESPPAEDAE